MWSSYTWIFFNQYIGNFFRDLQQLKKNVFSPLVYFIVRIQHVLAITYTVCVNPLFMLSVKLLVNSRLLIVRFSGRQKLHVDFRLRGWVSVPRRVVQRSAVSANVGFLFPGTGAELLGYVYCQDLGEGPILTFCLFSIPGPHSPLPLRCSLFLCLWPLWLYWLCVLPRGAH